MRHRGRVQAIDPGFPAQTRPGLQSVTEANLADNLLPLIAAGQPMPCSIATGKINTAHQANPSDLASVSEGRSSNWREYIAENRPKWVNPSPWLVCMS